VKAEQVKEENDSWKEEFEPVQIGEWTIAPSWKQDQLAEAKTPVLWIDPGAAFGTGYHGTTQDSLLFLQEINLGGKRVIDVGAGSGILSLFCVKQGAALPVVAIDVNPECTYEIMQNAQHNNIPADSVQVLIGDASSEEVRGQLPEQADLILMNIGGDENMMILPKIGHVLAAKGRLILSGLVEWNRDKIAAHLQMLGYKVIGERQTDEWVTLLTERT
ncbi:MAG: 50S ribosomal protein L11 methyltransferase, partial [Clostridia bacterium]